MHKLKHGKRAIKNCPFTPRHIVKVFGGYMCFERTSWNGENAFILGESAKELYDLIKTGYILGFDCLEQ